MNSFLKVLIENLLLRKGPQDFAYSTILMRLCLVIYFLTGLPSLMISASFEESVIAMALDVLVLLSFVYVCLQAFAKLPRFKQTVTALAGTGTAFQLAVLPLLYNAPGETGQAQAVLMMSVLLLMIVSWNLAVYAHIFREAFSIRLSAAILMTLSYVILSVAVRKLVFPELN